MERKSGSSSRSPSLSRRPSLKEKQSGGKVSRKKGPKKERWLLTRKTWRYMTDAVGNLLPEYTKSTTSRRGSLLGQFSGSSGSGSGSGSGVGVGSATCQPSTSTSASAGWVQQSQPATVLQQQQQQQQPQKTSKPTSPTSLVFPPWGSFPSHRPGVTPTGPGPGMLLQHQQGQGHVQHHKLTGPVIGPISKYINPFVDPEDIAQVEQHFQDVCTKEKKFLLWTRTKPKGLSGPALREMKQNFVDDKKHQDYFSETENEDEDVYADEYDVEDEEQITVRERRKSSTASSTVSIIGAPGRAFFSPPGFGGPSSFSDTTYTVIGSQGEQRIVRNTGTQTDPFPEELIIRLRLQAVHDERQRQIAQLIRQQQQQQLGLVDTMGGGDPLSGGGGMILGGPGSPTIGELAQWCSSVQGGGGPLGNLSVMTGTGIGGTGGGVPGSGVPLVLRGSTGLLGSTAMSSLSSKETVIPITQARPEIGQTGDESGRESEEKILDKSGSASGGGAEVDKKSEESGYSSSISDTVMKYLRIMRKNSKADIKEDRFKTVNYDRSLRNIKSKNVTVEEALEHEKNKALGLGGVKSEEGGPLPEIGNPTPKEASVGTKKGQQQAQAAQAAQASAQQMPSTSGPSSPVSPPSSPQLVQERDTTSMETSSPSPTLPSPTLPSGTEEAPKVVKGKKVKKGKVKSTPGTITSKVATGQAQTLDIKELESVKGQVELSTSEMEDIVVAHQVTMSMGGPLSPPLGSSAAMPERVASPPKEIGCQAGESLIRYLRKFSDFSSASASESPAELISLSPRLSIATNATEPITDSWFLAHHMYQHQHSTTSSGIPTTTRSSFDLYSSVGGGETSSQSDWEDAWVQQLLQYQQLFRQQQQQFQLDMSPPPQSSTTTGTVVTETKIPSPKIAADQRSCLNVKISSGSINPTSSTSTPSTPGGSSILSSHSTTGGGIMKSLFSSSPFGGFRSSSKKGSSTSTTSLITPGVNTTTSSTSRGLLGLGLGFPPTTSSSPNLTSLIHSASSSAHSHGRGHGHSSSGSGGGGFFRSSTADFSFGLGRSGFGSKVSHKEKMIVLLTDSSSVMQKSKSSSSVVGGTTGSSGGGGGGSGGRLISKSSRIFSKSRSKSSTRAATSSTGSAPSCSWAPQGKCKWRSPSGKTITLEETMATTLSEMERQTLQEVALEKLKGLQLGVEIKIPKEKIATSAKPKRRPYLLKKKSLSTGFFEGGKREDGKPESTGGGSGLVFGISLSQCVANDRLKQHQKEQQLQPTQSDTSTCSSLPAAPTAKNGSRSSISSDVHQDKGSTESLWGKRASVAAVHENIPSSQQIPPELLQQPKEPAVPQIVTACIQHLENYGLHTTGIFRVSTSLKRIRQLREDIDGGKEVQFGEEHSPHDVAALLKEFLRDLPDPLLSRELYQPFLKTQKIRNRKQQLEAVQHLVQLLPPANRDTLSSLLSLFAKVVANAGETKSPTGEILPGNKMEGYSLATLIAPNILPCMEGGTAGASADHTLTKERRESIDVVNYMITNHQQLFQISSELLHDVYLHMMDTQPEAVEAMLKVKSGFVDDPMDELETSSVFEGSECGDVPEAEESRIFRKREDILHEGAGRGGQPSYIQDSRLRGSERTRGRRESSRDRASEGHQSGGESDSSSTKSTSRWFRRSRPSESKMRTSSDSGGSEKIKSSSKTGISHGGLECKRANSLDSVNVKEAVPHVVASTAPREKSNSDQSLKVPENLNRRQSSPILESAGVITASLKIPVPVPLSIDDTDIPFIEDDQQEQTRYPMHPQPQPYPRSRGRSASTDSSVLVKSPSSSHTPTPISSPIRQLSSEVSSPLGFSPPGSPPYDPRTFPYEEMTARILIGGSAPDPVATSTATVNSPTNKVVTSSLYLQPAANTSAPSTAQTQPQTATASVYIPGVITDPKSLGKETKGASIGGLIKSKTADFEKLAKSSTGPTTSVSTATYSLAPKMRLRSQENIVLKQQFLLRQQQHQHPPNPHPPYAHPSQEEGRRQAEAKQRQLSMKQREATAPVTTTAPSMTEASRGTGGIAATTTVTSSTGTGLKPLRRTRPQLTSAFSSSILTSPPEPQHQTQLAKTPVTVTVRSSTIGGPTPRASAPTPAKPQPQPQQPQPAPSSSTSTSSSPSRWKRSEIIASRQDEQRGGSSKRKGPETLL